MANRHLHRVSYLIIRLSQCLAVMALTVGWLFTSSFSWAATTKEQSFQQVVKEIVHCFSKQDSAHLARYIHEGTGVYLAHRTGVFDKYDHIASAGFSDSSYPNILFHKRPLTYSGLKYAPLPTFNCDKEQWTRYGAFVDTTTTDHLLSETVATAQKLAGRPLSKETINHLRSLEQKSRRVVIAPAKSESSLVVYLSFIDGKWYLTIIDEVTTDCSA